MALGDARQVGQEFKLGFGDLEYTGYLPEDGVSLADNLATEEIVTDERGANLTRIYYNDGKVLEATFKIKSTGSITPPKKGSIVSITEPDSGLTTNWLTMDADVSYNRGISMLKLSLVREDSMQSTYDADATPAAPTVTLSDAGASILGASIEASWTTAANQPDYVDVYLNTSDSQPATPFVTFARTTTATSGSQTFTFTRQYGSGDTIYAWAVSRNSLSSTAGTDSQAVA